ncbi:hypothetical protein DFS34DRAFT_639636 [Phlyctochytrium arcticum]|nr:hypothetical protein DFS34DRAFT_639636 [Phlyctochytrium arcticum]
MALAAARMRLATVEESEAEILLPFEPPPSTSPVFLQHGAAHHHPDAATMSHTGFLNPLHHEPLSYPPSQQQQQAHQQPAFPTAHSMLYSILRRNSSALATPAPPYTPPTALLIQKHITILRLLVLSAVLFALIPIVTILAYLVPPPGPAVLAIVSAVLVFPAAIAALVLAVRRMREEEQRVRFLTDHLEMGGHGSCGLPDYADAEPLPQYAPKGTGVAEVMEPLIPGDDQEFLIATAYPV